MIVAVAAAAWIVTYVATTELLAAVAAQVDSGTVGLVSAVLSFVAAVLVALLGRKKPSGEAGGTTANVAINALARAEQEIGQLNSLLAERDARIRDLETRIARRRSR